MAEIEQPAEADAELNLDPDDVAELDEAGEVIIEESDLRAVRRDAHMSGAYYQTLRGLGMSAASARDLTIEWMGILAGAYDHGDDD